LDAPRADPDAAEEALREAEQAKRDQEMKWNAVVRVTNALKSHQDENHFAQLFADAMKRRRA